MATKLEQLLASIDPAKTYDRTFARANTAISSFGMKTGQITDHQEFIEYLTRFFCYVESAILNSSHSEPFDLDHDWDWCRRLLSRLYGSRGTVTAFDMVRTGNEGGLYAVLKAIALRTAEEYADNEIHHRVSDYWDHLKPDEVLPAVHEYLDRYGHLLPSEITENGAASVCGNFFTILKRHPKLLRTLRNVGR